MADSPLQSADPVRAKVLLQKIVARWADAPRHVAALEEAMAAFGDDFDAEPFSRALASAEPRELNKAKAVERGLDQLFNYIAELNAQGLELARLRGRGDQANAAADLKQLVVIGVLSVERGKRLQRLRELRRLMIHDYPGTRASQVHEAVRLLTDEWPGYQRAFQRWMKAGFLSERSGGSRRGAGRPPAPAPR